MPRSVHIRPAALRFGRCEIRTDTREVRLDGQLQRVRRRVFDLIVYLAQQRPRAVQHAEVLRAVWQREEASPSLLARAVMEARRAVGDTAAEPRIILSVHGVGYRFAVSADNALFGDTPMPGPDFVDDEADEAIVMDTLVARARTAVFERRYDGASRLADELMDQARALGSRAGLVRGWLVRGSVALNTGKVDKAARDFAQALRLAQAEGIAPLVAEAELSIGELHVTAGDLDIGVRHLRAAMDTFSQPACEPELIRCLGGLSLALRGQGELEAGLQVCRRSIELMAKFKGPNCALGDRLNEVAFVSMLGDRDAELGHHAAARQRFEEALALNAALMIDASVENGGGLWLACLNQRALLLERTDRPDEAWAAAQRCREFMASHPEVAAPVGPCNPSTIDLQHARLLARLGYREEALAMAHKVLASGESSDLPLEFDEEYRQASLVAERAGDLATALRWERLRCDAQARNQRARSASLAAILAAACGSDDGQAELDNARAQFDALRRSHVELNARLARLATAMPVDPRTGMADAALLSIHFAAGLARARVRGLPMCIGVLTASEASLPPSLLEPDATNRLLYQLAELLAAQSDVAQPAVRVGRVAVAFQILDGGPKHAAMVCQNLLDSLRASAIPALAWRCSAVDAVAEGSVEACVRALLGPGQAASAQVGRQPGRDPGPCSLMLPARSQFSSPASRDPPLRC